MPDSKLPDLTWTTTDGVAYEVHRAVNGPRRGEWLVTRTANGLRRHLSQFGNWLDPEEDNLPRGSWPTRNTAMWALRFDGGNYRKGVRILDVAGVSVPAEYRPLWYHEKGLMQTRTGYGQRLTTGNVVLWPGPDGRQRWRRVYCCCFSNSGTCYIDGPKGPDGKRPWLIVND